MNINYYEKKIILLNTKKIFHSSQMRTSPQASEMGRARKVNAKLNWAGQPGPHFVGQNAGQVKTNRASPLCHP